MIKCTKYT